MSTAAQVAASPRIIPAAALCWSLCTMLAAPHVAAETASTEQYPRVETTRTSATSEPDGEPAAVKPWLITPTLAADPKLGANVGGVVAYLRQLDEQSTTSMVGPSVSYSDTDSITGGIGARLFWGADTRQLTLLVGVAEINNEYDDFLGTGQKAKTTDSLHTVEFRYLQQIGASNWLAGVQALSTNYSVGAEGYIDGLLNLIGLSGFDSAGLGLVLQHDTMDRQRDPTGGHLLTLHNTTYRESLGGEASFDVIFTDFWW